MTACTSRSHASRAGLEAGLALAIGLAGCHFNECDERRKTVELAPEGPGTAAIHVHGSTPSRYQYVAARWLGTAVNHDTVPCRLGVYEHERAPVAESVPVLDRSTSAPEATADGGRLVFESLLLGARDGRAFVRRINQAPFDDEFVYGSYLEPDDDEDLEHIDVWLTIATCDQPEVEVTLDVVGEVCVGYQRPRGDVKTEVWWPES